MKKITFSLIFIVVFLTLFIMPKVNAYNSTTKLVQDQKVIINHNVTDESAKNIGNSGYYSTTIDKLTESGLNNNSEINPILNYRQNLVVNDPMEPQAYLNLLNAENFWDITADASGEVIALIDGGIALNHEDLVDRWAINIDEFGVTENEGPIPNCTSRGLDLDKSCNNLDDDGNGYVDDWRGWDFAWSDNDPMVGTTSPDAPGVNHATLIAGLIGATGNNAVGIASLNWQSKIMPLQIFTDEGDASTLELAEAISYAIDMNVDVINLSLGSDTVDPTIESLLETANDNGIIVVAAVGNCSGESYAENGCSTEGQMLYPSTSDYVIAVGASNLDDTWASFSGRGPEIDILALGSGSIITTDYSSANPTSMYSGSVYGSSYSAPLVSSLAAKLLSVWPNASPSDTRAIIIDSAIKPTGMLGNLFTTSYGFGRVNPVLALNRAGLCKNIVNASDINCDGSVNLLDLSLLSSQWQKQNTGRSDVNKSGLVDLLDLSLIASRWGQ